MFGVISVAFKMGGKADEPYVLEFATEAEARHKLDIIRKAEVSHYAILVDEAGLKLYRAYQALAQLAFLGPDSLHYRDALSSFGTAVIDAGYAETLGQADIAQVFHLAFQPHIFETVKSAWF